MKKREDLKFIEEDEDEDEDDEEKKFIKDVHTFPRICNILMTQPDALIRDGLLASRIDLQFKEIGDKQLVFLEAASKFNDKTFKSGGLVGEHWMFKDSAVNPENFCENSKPAGKISAKRLRKIWLEVKSKYPKMKSNF